MDQVDLTPLVDQLGDDIDELEEALSTLTDATLAETTSKLPLLDKANLFVLVTYAIESILFCKYWSSPNDHKWSLMVA